MTYDAETKFIAEKFNHFSDALSWAHSPLNAMDQRIKW